MQVTIHVKVSVIYDTVQSLTGKILMSLTNYSLIFPVFNVTLMTVSILLEQNQPKQEKLLLDSIGLGSYIV